MEGVLLVDVYIKVDTSAGPKCESNTTYGDVNNFEDEESGTCIYIAVCIYVPVKYQNVSSLINT